MAVADRARKGPEIRNCCELIRLNNNVVVSESVKFDEFWWHVLMFNQKGVFNSRSEIECLSVRKADPVPASLGKSYPQISQITQIKENTRARKQ